MKVRSVQVEGWFRVRVRVRVKVKVERVSGEG